MHFTDFFPRHSLRPAVLVCAAVLLCGCASTPADTAQIGGKRSFLERMDNSIDKVLDGTDTAHAGDDNSPQ